MKLRDQFKHNDVVQILDAPKGRNIGTVISVGYKYVQVAQANVNPADARLEDVTSCLASNLRKITT